MNPADECLGMPGRMLSSHKEARGRNIYWNACVFQAEGRATKAKHKKGKQIWHGDIDLDASAEALQRLANELRSAIYVTPENPWRFKGFEQAMRQLDTKDPRQPIVFRPKS